MTDPVPNPMESPSQPLGFTPPGFTPSGFTPPGSLALSLCECPVCREIMILPQIGNACGHSVCGVCALRVGPRCPVCRAIVRFSPNIDFRKVVEATDPESYARRLLEFQPMFDIRSAAQGIRGFAFREKNFDDPPFEAFLLKQLQAVIKHQREPGFSATDFFPPGTAVVSVTPQSAKTAGLSFDDSLYRRYMCVCEVWVMKPPTATQPTAQWAKANRLLTFLIPRTAPTVAPRS